MCKTWQNLAKLGKFCTLLALRIKTKKSSKGPDKKDKVENSGRIPRNPGQWTVWPASCGRLACGSYPWLSLLPGLATSPLQSKAISACREGSLKAPPRRRVNWSTPSINSLNHGVVNNVKVLLLLVDFIMVPVHMLVTISICMVDMMGHTSRTPSTSWTQGLGLGVVICPVLVPWVRLGVGWFPMMRHCCVLEGMAISLTQPSQGLSSPRTGALVVDIEDGRMSSMHMTLREVRKLVVSASYVM